MSGEPPIASVVIVAFHDAVSVDRLLGRLEGGGLEVVVVNVEADKDVSAAATGRATVIPLHENRGYAAAVNAGVRATTSPFIVFMNDDVIATASAVRRLVTRLDAPAGPDVVVPKVRSGRGRLQPTIFALATPAALAIEWALLPDQPLWPLHRLRVQKWRRPTQMEAVEAASGVVVAARRSLLLARPLPEEFFMYWEDAAWFFALSREGLRVVYDPAVEVCHDGGRDDVRSEKAVLIARNAVRCVRRTQGRAAAGAAWVIVVLWHIRLVAQASVIRRRDVGARLAGLRAALRAVAEI